MKQGIHPEIHKDAKTTCVSCGAVYKIPTTVKKQSVEVCSACHPVYTGEYRAITSSGRVDRFRKMQAASKKRRQEDDEKIIKKNKPVTQKAVEKKRVKQPSEKKEKKA